jgi:cobaltochelatase CobS
MKFSNNMENTTKKELELIAETSTNALIQNLAKEKIKEEFAGDIVAQKMIQLSQILGKQQTQSLDEKEVKSLIKEYLETDKIKLINLDESVKKLLEGQVATLKITITKGNTTVVVSKTISASIGRPLIQNILSDALARNNIYLYGGAGTGKSFSAQTVADLLGWELIEVNCNQFTSPLELIGGQTIDGYQEGKVIRAFGNINNDGSPMNKGCVLLLDELPKIDPNTAGILNAALAKVSQYKIVNNQKIAATLSNAKGDKIERGEILIIGTGNTLLNTVDSDYEANFKQDLSLQDRFVGSTYEVFVDEFNEWNFILEQKWAFIFIYLLKLRKEIKNQGFLGKAFVSIRIMQSVQKTYNVFRTIKENNSKSFVLKPDSDISYTPAPIEMALASIEKSKVKTVKDSMDEFFNLFTKEQADELKEKTDYNGWLQIIKEKNKLPLDKLNTTEELNEIEKLIE